MGSYPIPLTTFSSIWRSSPFLDANRVALPKNKRDGALAKTRARAPIVVHVYCIRHTPYKFEYHLCNRYPVRTRHCWTTMAWTSPGRHPASCIEISGDFGARMFTWSRSKHEKQMIDASPLHYLNNRFVNFSSQTVFLKGVSRHKHVNLASCVYDRFRSVITRTTCRHFLSVAFVTFNCNCLIPLLLRAGL